MKKRRQGFSLAEALLSFALFLLVLSLITQGISQLSQITKFFDAKSQVFSSATSALGRICSDAREATQITMPMAGDPATYAQLDIKKVEPSQWANYYPTTPPTPWNPRDASLEETLKYSLSGDQLQCQTITGSGMQVETVSFGVQGFTVRRVQNLCLEIRLAYLVNDNLTSFTRLLWLPQMPERTHP